MASDYSATGGSLSPYNIEDPMLRGELYREIRNAQTDSSTREDDYWAAYEIQPADILSPELVAYKCYGLDTLKWVIMMAASLDDSRESLTAGVDIYLPTAAYLRQRIRYYADMGVRE